MKLNITLLDTKAIKQITISVCGSSSMRWKEMESRLNRSKKIWFEKFDIYCKFIQWVFLILMYLCE